MRGQPSEGPPAHVQGAHCPPTRCSRSLQAQVPAQGGPAPAAEGRGRAARALHAAGSSAPHQASRREAVRDGGSAATRGHGCWGSNTRRLPTLRGRRGLRPSLPTQTAEPEGPAQPPHPRPPQSLGALGPALAVTLASTSLPHLPDSRLFQGRCSPGASPLLPAQPLQRPKASTGHRAAPSVQAAGVHLPTRRPQEPADPPAAPPRAPGESPLGAPVTRVTALPPLG